MPTVTGFNASSDDGAEVPVDAFGNNAAISCLSCGAPVLVVCRPNQRGSAEDRMAPCGYCGASYWIEVDSESETLVVHSDDSGRYVRGNEPKLTAERNKLSWGVISAMLEAYAGATYDDMVAAVSQHDHEDGGSGFVDYCIRNEWLIRERE